MWCRQPTLFTYYQPMTSQHHVYLIRRILRFLTHFHISDFVSYFLNLWLVARCPKDVNINVHHSEHCNIIHSCRGRIILKSKTIHMHRTCFENDKSWGMYAKSETNIMCHVFQSLRIKNSLYSSRSRVVAYAINSVNSIHSDRRTWPYLSLCSSVDHRDANKNTKECGEETRETSAEYRKFECWPRAKWDKMYQIRYIQSIGLMVKSVANKFYLYLHFGKCSIFAYEYGYY